METSLVQNIPTMKLHRSTALQVRELNVFFSCFICKGYMVDPTIVENCWHSYCRSCIVQHLLSDPFCPQCKSGGGKHVSISNLKSDDVLRALIYKLVPGLYKRERERILQFSTELRYEQHNPIEEPSNGGKELELEKNLFSPIEPISLSLEYYPALLVGCTSSVIPPVRYLQCPAGLKIRHLKRFLCSKYDIDPENKHIEVEVIYEDEVLPNDFSLMDVGYCYNWKRHAPMKFTYRILIYGEKFQHCGNFHCKANGDLKNGPHYKNQRAPQIDKLLSSNQSRAVKFSDNDNTTSLSPMTAHITQTATVNKRKNKQKKQPATELKESPSSTASESCAPVKVVIARKSADSKKSLSKRFHCGEAAIHAGANDFKSLRSNDLRYSDYAVTSTTSCSSATKHIQGTLKGTEESDSPDIPVSKCDIVVSIPHSQMPKSPYAADEQFENVSLVHLKTASKKSPNSTAVGSDESVKGVKNVPKLKIELSSLKAKVKIPKPKSADAKLDGAYDVRRVKHRKYSLDEIGHIADKVDLETYAKHIGLQPIEVLTPLEPCGKLKFSPNASPLSSSSSSTTSSSNSNCATVSCAELVSSSFHRKRKKKHSKDLKDQNGKRRRLHAEISSQPADESLKMKVKIMAPHNYRAHKADNRKTVENCVEGSQDGCLIGAKTKDQDGEACGEDASESLTAALNKTLSEESMSINHLMKEKEELHEGNVTIKTPLLPKLISSIKEAKIPSSPPLPPSLFKTTSLNFNTLSVSNTDKSQPKQPNIVANQSESANEQLHLIKRTTTKAITTTTTTMTSTTASPSSKFTTVAMDKPHATTKGQQFVVPNLPRRTPPASTNSQKFVGPPSSIASATNKQIGMQLKRSTSLDEPYTSSTSALKKQQKLELDRLMRKNVYGAFSSSVHSGATFKYQNSHGTIHKEEKVPSSVASAIGTRFELPAFYVPNAGKYSQSEYGKRKALSVPTSSISICKITDATCNVQASSCTNAVTITARQRPTMTQSQWTAPPYNQTHLPFNKPAVEIVRITSNQIPADLQPLPPRSPPRSNRLMGPPLSMVKGKKINNQLPKTPRFSSGIKSPPLVLNSTEIAQGPTYSSYSTSPSALMNLQSINPSKQCVSADLSLKKPKGDGKAHGITTETQKNNLREFRPTSKDGSMEILNATASSNEPEQLGEFGSSGTLPVISDSLEAALNKIKRNITSTTVPHCVSAKKLQLGTGESRSDDLQNLHMLSESATTREKIAIRSTTHLFEKPKLQQSSTVRQQNASVRNIPNPSALAFRNTGGLLPASSASSLTTVVTTTVSSDGVTSQRTVTAATPSTTCSSEKLISFPITGASVPLSVSTPLSLSVGRTGKKPTTIDQVAANLNMRAAAAEAYAAKTNVAEDTLQITSTTKSSLAAESQRQSSVSENIDNCTKKCDSSTNSSEALKATRVGNNAIEKLKNLSTTGSDKVATIVAPASPDSVSNNNSNNNSSKLTSSSA